MAGLISRFIQRCAMTIAGNKRSETTISLTWEPRPSRTCILFLMIMSLLSLVLIYQQQIMMHPHNASSIMLLGSLKSVNRDLKQLEAEMEGNRSLSINKTFENYGKIFHTPIINCENIFAGAKSDIEKGQRLAKEMRTSVPLISDDFYINQTKNCEMFIRTRGYINFYLTKEEREFPIAFSILVYKEAEMVDRLLRAIYRPQNIYCIHVDSKSDDKFLRSIIGISQCFPNVFIASRRISVVWGTFSVLEPELVCMKDIWSRGSKWKYFINLTGQEFPLKTNWELVQILKAYDGANDIEGTIRRANKERWRDSGPPKGIRPLKGSVHICANRKFIDYILYNDTAQAFLSWTQNTFIPDETFFASLNHNPQLGIPGTYKGWPETDRTRKPFLTRFKNWNNDPSNDYPCAGYWTRNICILSTGDLPLLGNVRHLFANKFHLVEDRIVIGCLEEKHFNDTRDEYYGFKSFNTSFYHNLDFVRNKYPVWTLEDAES